MAVYRYQVVSVGLWRGKIKRWNTTFHSTSVSALPAFYSRMQASGYKAAGDVIGDCSGGTASITRYAAAGGPPLEQVVYFDWQTPSEWIPYTGTIWATIDPATPVDAAGESALVVEGLMAGLSVTGKPVRTRKYLHAVPSRTAAAWDDPDVPSAVVTAAEALWTPTYMQNPAGVSPASVSVDQWYGSHQRVRGRRRTTRQVAGQAFSLGVLAGGGATTSGQGDTFPGGEF